MNSYTLYLLLFLNTMCALSAPTTNSFNVYDKLVELSEDEKYKCPYLRQTLLLKPEPRFLAPCDISSNTMSSKEYSPILASYSLCGLYYESFKKVCSISPSLDHKITQSLFGKEILSSKLGLNNTCESLRKVGELGVEFEMNLSGAVVRDEGLCRRLCADGEGATPLCEWSALMLNEFHSKSEAVKPKVLENNSMEAVKPNLGKAVKVTTPTRKIDPNISTNAAEGAASKLKQNVNSVLNMIAPAAIQPGNGSNPIVDSVSNLNVVKMKPAGEVTNTKTKPAGDVASIVNTDVRQPITSKKEETKTNFENENTSVVKDLPINGVKTMPTDIILTNTGVKSENEGKPPSNQNTVEDPDKNPVEDPDKNPVEAPNKNPVEDQNKNSAKGEDNNSNIQKIAPSKAVVDNNNDNVEGNLESEGESVPQSVANDVKTAQTTTPDSSETQNIQVEAQAPQLEKEDSRKSNNIAYDEDEEAKKTVEKTKPLEIDEDNTSSLSSYTSQAIEEDDSYFFSYFMMICIVFILGYVGYHNKQKILAMVLEGRRGKRQQRRRPNSANYHKLDSNLEEAVTSSCNKNTTNIIY